MEMDAMIHIINTASLGHHKIVECMRFGLSTIFQLFFLLAENGVCDTIFQQISNFFSVVYAICCNNCQTNKNLHPKTKKMYQTAHCERKKIVGNLLVSTTFL